MVNKMKLDRLKLLKDYIERNVVSNREICVHILKEDTRDDTGEQEQKDKKSKKGKTVDKKEEKAQEKGDKTIKDLDKLGEILVTLTEQRQKSKEMQIERDMKVLELFEKIIDNIY